MIKQVNMWYNKIVGGFMKKGIKITLIVIGVVIGIILLDTIQALVFNNNPIIGFQTKCRSKQGIFVTTYHCENGKNITRLKDSTCSTETVCNEIQNKPNNQLGNSAISWNEISEEGVNEQELFESVNLDDLERIATLFQSLSKEIGEKQKDPDFYFSGQWYHFILESSQFQEVLNMGENALKPLYFIVYKSPNQYLYEYICCMAIQKITDYEIEDWNTSKDFLEKFNKYICDHREL